MFESLHAPKVVKCLLSCFLVFLSWLQYRHKSREMFFVDALGKSPSLTRDRNISYISNSAKLKEF